MASNEKIIRRLTPDDTVVYREIRLEGLRREAGAFTASLHEENEQDLNFFTARITENVIFGGYVDGRLCGIAVFHKRAPEKTSHKGVINGVYVAEEFRGLGLGRDLMDAAVTYARHEVEIIQLTVVSSNHGALKFYEQYGFTPYGIEPHAFKVGDHYEDETLMYLNV